jgi:hypothetical protein
VSAPDDVRIAFTLTSQDVDGAGLSPGAVLRVAGWHFLILLAAFDKAPILALRIPARKWAIGSGSGRWCRPRSLEARLLSTVPAGPVSVAASQFAAFRGAAVGDLNKEADAHMAGPFGCGRRAESAWR